jgi:hypothetical protein
MKPMCCCSVSAIKSLLMLATLGLAKQAAK